MNVAECTQDSRITASKICTKYGLFWTTTSTASSFPHHNITMVLKYISSYPRWLYIPVMLHIFIPESHIFESLLAWRCLEMRIWRILHFVKENKVSHFNTMMHCSARFSATLLGRAGNHVGQYSSRVVPVDCYVAGAVWLCSAQDFCCCLQICNQPPACVFYSWVDRYSPPLEHIRTFCVFIYCKSIIYTYIDLFQGA